MVAAKRAKIAHQQELARAKREASVIPEVIFQIETFDVNCAKLGKLTGCTIVKGMKRTVNRDFRILPAAQ
jgi:hypothetical protein